MKEILNKKRFQKALPQLCTLHVRDLVVGVHLLTHTEVYALCREENKAFYCMGVGLCLWNGCCVNGDMCECRKLSCLWQSLSPEKNKATHVVGCLFSTTISGIPKEPEMGNDHRSPFGEKCKFVQKKNGVVYLRTLRTGGDLMTRRTMWTYVWLTRSRSM